MIVLQRLVLRALGFAAIVAVPFSAAQGQVLRGRVLRDATRAPIEGAEVSLVGTERHAITDSTGTFVLDDLEEGWQIVQVRKLGFAVRRDTVNVRGSRVTTREFLLATQTSLDTVKTVSARDRYRSPALRDFEDRRANASAGYFITEDDLRKQDEKSLAGVIVQKAPGIVPISRSGVGTMLASSRKVCSGPVFMQTEKSCQSCFVTVYVDGQLVYEANPDRKSDAAVPPDFDRMPVKEFAAVEFYPGSGSAPVQFGRTSSGCGVLLLWSREK